MPQQGQNSPSWFVGIISADHLYFNRYSQKGQAKTFGSYMRSYSNQELTSNPYTSRYNEEWQEGDDVWMRKDIGFSNNTT